MSPRFRVGLLATHPIQYYSPWYRALARLCDLHVFYAHQQVAADHARSEFGVAFEWDLPLLEGYSASFLENRALRPDVSRFWGCDTPAIAAIVRRERFDAFIVLGWGVRSYWQAMAACWRTGTPLLVRGDSHLLTPRSLPRRLAKRLAYRSFIPRFDAYLVVGERSRQYFLHYGADPRRMFSVPHAADNGYFAGRAQALVEERRSLRTCWGIPEDATVFLFAGKLAAHKRPGDFVHAIAAASRRQSKIVGLVVGDGPLRQELEAWSVDADAPLRFTGFLNQSDMPRAYASSDLLVLTSDETWGMVVNEAMASRRAAVVCDRVGCAPDLIIPGRTGELFPWGDRAALTERLALLAADPAQLAALGRAAQRHIQGYSVERAAAGAFSAIVATARGTCSYAA